MARPRAIYASVPPNELGIPKWDDVSGVIPVKYSKPYQYWPSLDWRGNSIDESSPTEYNLEHPKYLWSHPVVQDPVYGESHIFIRQWYVGEPGGAFDYQSIPADDLIFVINHAADDQYALALVIGDLENGNLEKPLGSNSQVPEGSSWRNIKTFFYHVDLTNVPLGTPLNLISEVTNAPQIPHGNVDNNPAMFIWIMYIYDNSSPKNIRKVFRAPSKQLSL